MKIGIVGAGNVGRLYGRRWVERGHRVSFSYVRDARRLEDLVGALGPHASAVEPEEIAQRSDVVVFAPPFERVRDAAARVGALAGKVVIDTTNPFNPERAGLVDLGGSTSFEIVAALFPEARLVKALHNLSVEQASNAIAGTPAVMTVAGDDGAAKDIVARLIVDAGLIPFDTGSLSAARLSEAPGPLFMTSYGVTTIGQAVDEIRQAAVG